jgi:hypothetical protein
MNELVAWVDLAERGALTRPRGDGAGGVNRIGYRSIPSIGRDAAPETLGEDYDRNNRTRSERTVKRICG